MSRCLPWVLPLGLTWASTAQAQNPPPWQFSADAIPSETKPVPTPVARDPWTQLPRLGFTESPFGMPANAGFVALSGLGTSAKSTNEAEGGVRVGFAPLSRLTIHGFAGRDGQGRFSPSAALHLRLLGDGARGGALGLLGQYKAEGFSELGGEAEIGLTAGWKGARWTLAANAIVGVGVEEKEEGEVDGELKARAGYDLGGGFRLGAEGQARRRFAGPNSLAGGRTWDALGGPMLAWQGEPMTVAMSFGPSTTGVAQGVGAYGMLTVAAAFFR